MGLIMKFNNNKISSDNILNIKSVELHIFGNKNVTDLLTQHI